VCGPIVADAGAVAEPVLVTAFAGPFYPWSWAEPQLRHLEVEFAAGVAVTFVIAAAWRGELLAEALESRIRCPLPPA
jgi:hypothetical protein